MAQLDRWLEYGPQGKSIQLQDWFLPQLYQRGSDMPLVGRSVRPNTRQESTKAPPTRDRPRFPTGQHIGAFPRPPLYNFHGRARELQALERAFRPDRAILLHAMGGMGKTTLAREAGDWLTRTGLFLDGACFLSFEQPVTAERIAQVLGSYLEGHSFEALSQAEHDDASIVRTCNLLGVVERKAGRLSEAREWYERSREIAQRRGDTESLGVAAQNIGSLCQEEGEAARQRGDEASARQRSAEAERFLHESLRMEINRQDKPSEAMSRVQLARVYLFLGELVKAEAHAHQAREIDEGLGLIRHLPHDYYSLAQIARTRGDEVQAVQWEAKRHEVEVELARRARGGAAADASL
jgi:tetratricopeptide (TPR) repeat protein